jgi:hypothetical protein
MGQKSVLGFKHIFTSVGKCKKMSFNIFKWIFILVVEISGVFKFFETRFEKNLVKTKVYLKCWKGLIYIYIYIDLELFI